MASQLLDLIVVRQKREPINDALLDRSVMNHEAHRSRQRNGVRPFPKHRIGNRNSSDHGQVLIFLFVLRVLPEFDEVVRRTQDNGIRHRMGYDTNIPIFFALEPNNVKN